MRRRPKKLRSKAGSKKVASTTRIAWLSPRMLVVVFLAAVVPYLRTWGFEYTYDDHSHVVRNPFLQDPSNAWALLSRYFQLEVPDQNRPVLLMSHFLDRSLGGGAAGVAHLQSALWHGIASVLVSSLGRELGLRAHVAFAAGLLFALHPVLAEAVAGISNREDVLATVFALAALLLAKRALPGGLGAAAGAVLCFALAIFSKEVAVVLPLLFALALVWLRPWRAESTRRSVAALSVGAFIVLGGWLTVQLRLGTPGLKRDAGAAPLQQAFHPSAVQAPLSAVTSPLAVSAFAYTVAETPAIPGRDVHVRLGLHHALTVEAFRLVQLAVGYPTSSEYDLAVFKRPLAWAISLLVLFGVAAGGLRVRRSAPVAFVSLLFACVATVPVLAPPLLINPLADRFLYLPAVGACWVLSWCLLDGIPAWAGKDVRDLGLPLLLLWLGGFFALGISSIGRWKNDVALFSHAAKWAPNSARVHQNLGAALLEREQVVAAEAALLRAVRLDPSLIAAHYNLGRLSEQTNRRRSAIEHYQAGLGQRSVRGELPLRERILTRLGRLLLRAKRYDTLEQALEAERAAHPDNGAIADIAGRLEAARSRAKR